MVRTTVQLNFYFTVLTVISENCWVSKQDFKILDKMSSSSGSDCDLSQGERLLDNFLQNSQTKSQPTQTSPVIGQEDQTKEVQLHQQCAKCWMLDLVGTEDSQNNLLRRFCPNCNEAVYVCSIHERCYSPHGIKCAVEGQKVVKRPYLRKRRRPIVIVVQPKRKNPT